MRNSSPGSFQFLIDTALSFIFKACGRINRLLMYYSEQKQIRGPSPRLLAMKVTKQNSLGDAELHSILNVVSIPFIFFQNQNNLRIFWPSVLRMFMKLPQSTATEARRNGTHKLLLLL